VTARIAAAVVGGYFAAHAFAAFMTLVLPFARPDRVVTGTLLAFLVWCVAALHAFAARSAWRAWWVPVAAGIVLLGIALTFPEAGTRP
ncbi:MAG: DUF3649 domain-containing protein, partial [Proteobacteria bacterium]|nr:DUF3649 domain-containing protein [Pseudomonadota bacterium]